MDVLCPQCAYAYELDDALISSTGTLVRCTKCEHKFRVAKNANDEPWVVRTFDGGTARYRNLPDVQQAIIRGELGRSDLLARGTGPARPLGSIVELEGFFDEQARQDDSRLSLHTGSIPDDVATSPNLLSDPSAIVLESLPDVSAALTSTSSVSVVSPFARAPSSFPPPFPPKPPLSGAPASSSVSTANPVLVAAREVMPSSDRSHAGPTPMSTSFPGDSQRAAAPIEVRPKARATGWVVAASLIVAVASGAFLLGRRYTKAAADVPTATVVPTAVEVDAALADVRAGRIEQGRERIEALSKALGADASILAARAELALSQADVAACVALVAKKTGAADSGALALAAEERASEAVKAVERAAETIPDGADSLDRLAQAFALSGAKARSRQWVERLGADDGSHAYARALLASVEGADDRVARLERAFASEPFRARLRALTEGVLADDSTMQTALVASLRAGTDAASLLRWLDALPAVAAVDAGNVVDAASVRAGAAGDDFGVPFEGADTESAGATGPRAGRKLATNDPRKALEEGERARRRGDLDDAKALYKVALDANPLDSEALAGLGDCARDSREMASAIGFYRRALSANPSYLPARLGLADAQWASGDRASAAKGYREIIESFPEGAYPPVVRERGLGRASGPEEP